MTTAPRHITICMGSSCFVRGNQRHARTIAAWIRQHGVTADISGHHCRECCASGPIITIDGETIVVDNDGQLDNQLRTRLL